MRTLSGNYQLVQLAPWLLSSENPVRFEFISHKLLRLVVPFGFGSAARSMRALLTAVRLYRVALVLQLAFYALSLLALASSAQRAGFSGRAANAAGTFVILNTRPWWLSPISWRAVSRHGPAEIQKAGVFCNGGANWLAHTGNMRSKRRKTEVGQKLPLAYGALLIFTFLYYTRPEDLIPGLKVIPLEKIVGGIALIALIVTLASGGDKRKVSAWNSSCSCFSLSN